MGIKIKNTGTKLIREEIEIDATGKPLGRLAVSIAHYLQGKHKKDYRPNIDFPIFIIIKNAKKIVFTGKKLKQKIIYRNTAGYIGHVKEHKLEQLWSKNPMFIIQRAVTGMLPKNKLRQRRIKRLELKN
ncbi:MAG: 50S ribosomal protein L13 [Patescibacteria group bacterium]